MKLGDRLFNSKGREFVVVEKISGSRTKPCQYKIKFTETGYETIRSSGDLKKGLVRDKLIPEVFGIGCLGYASYNDHPKAYERWASMLQRCYSKDYTWYKSYGGKGVTVCSRWHRFDNFLEDFVKLEGYSENDLANLQLDKDIKLKGNKIYSPDTCKLVSRQLNASHMNHNRPELALRFVAITPEGKEIQGKNISQFARDNNLNKTCIWMCMEDKIKTHKGWQFIRTEDGKKRKVTKEIIK